MTLMRYRPEVYTPQVAGWISLGDTQNSLDDAARVIGQKRDNRSIENYRIVVVWEEL